MEVAQRSPLPVGVVPWRSRPRVWTVVLKRTFDIVPGGTATPSRDAVPLSLDVEGAGGVLLASTDFAPMKNECDVVLVGPVLLDEVGPARLAVEPVRKLVTQPAELGPAFRGVGPLGDPTEPSATSKWERDGFDVDAFQCAPRDQRAPLSPFPFDLIVDVGPDRMVTRVAPTTPECLLLDVDRWLAPRAVMLQADTIAIDPYAQSLAITYRGIVELPERIEPLIVFEVAAKLRAFTPREMETWPRDEAVDPSLLRRLGRFRATEKLATQEDDGEDSLSMTARIDPPSESTTTHDVAVAADDDATVPKIRTGPQIAAPARAPSFGAPPPPRPSQPGLPVRPPAELPKPKLGGLMMLPLENRKPGGASSIPPSRERESDEGDE